MSEANERLFLLQTTSWKSAAKRSLCGNLLTLSEQLMEVRRKAKSLRQSSHPSVTPLVVRDPDLSGEQSSHPDHQNQMSLYIKCLQDHFYQ